jgi:hypothetical protein
LSASSWRKKHVPLDRGLGEPQSSSGPDDKITQQQMENINDIPNIKHSIKTHLGSS